MSICLTRGGACSDVSASLQGNQGVQLEVERISVGIAMSRIDLYHSATKLPIISLSCRSTEARDLMTRTLASDLAVKTSAAYRARPCTLHGSPRRYASRPGMRRSLHGLES
jgi:hypothetical protein